MEYKDRLAHYRDRQQRARSGLFNCIPWPFRRFRNYLPGTEKGKYIIVTANQKVGKSKFVDYVYVYEAILFLLAHPEVRLKIFYFTLEVSPASKEDEFNSFLLYKLDGIEISPTDLNSVNSDKPVDDKIIELLASDRYQRYRDKYKEVVTYIDDIRNPTGINKYCRDYALSHGHLNYSDDSYTDEMGNIRKLVNKDNPYTFDDEEEYRYIIIDNAANFTQESGLSKMDTINKMSKYLITLRDQLMYTCILVQHQAQSQEDLEHAKMSKLKPSSDGLADCKTTSRDANLLIGLYSPFKYGIDRYEGYDIKKFKNYIRFMEVLEDRDYGANGQISPLFFNGATSTFKELPLPDDREMAEVYNYVDRLNSIRNTRAEGLNKSFFIFNKFKQLTKK